MSAIKVGSDRFSSPRISCYIWTVLYLYLNYQPKNSSYNMAGRGKETETIVLFVGKFSI